MDRVLLIIDDVHYNRQVEMTLRKLGFDVESVNTEFNLKEPLLSFNPDYIIVRGQSARLNVINVAKKLKEASNQKNKVILVFPHNAELTTDELFKIRGDIILNDPISTLRLVMYIVLLSGTDIEFVKEKLLKYAITDSQFRAGEQQFLKSVGVSIDSEIELISNINKIEDMETGSSYLYDPLTKKTGAQENKPNSIQVSGVIPDQKNEAKLLDGQDRIEDERIFVSGDFEISDETKQRLADEINRFSLDASSRIESYNQIISNVDQDLKKGLNKRQTKLEFNKNRDYFMAQNLGDRSSEEDLDRERIQFAEALFKK
jgi:hypothetical protein